MFNIIYRDGAPENTGHFETVSTDGSSSYKVGQAVYLDSNGKAKLCGGATNANKIYGIVAKDAASTDKDVLVLKVEKDMIFKCPITGANIASAHKGFKLAIGTTDYGSVVSAASTLGTSYIGATVVDEPITSGGVSMVEVRFEN